MIKHRIKQTPHAKNYGPQITHMAECETKLKLKKSIAAIILLEIVEEDGKRESRRGKTRAWIRKREEKEYFNNIVQEQIIEDTLGYREMMRLFYQTSNVYKRVLS